MFTVIAQRRDDLTQAQKTQVQPVAERGDAMMLAQTWSNGSPTDVQIYRSGETDPLCVYRLGERVACRCPDVAQASVSPFDAAS